MAVSLSRFTVVGGAGVSAISGTATAEAVTITVKDLSRTFVRMTNVSSTLTALCTISASADPHVSYGQGSQATYVQPEASIYWGASIDSTRFKSTSGTLVITTTSSADGVTFEVGELTKY